MSLEIGKQPVTADARRAWMVAAGKEKPKGEAEAMLALQGLMWKHAISKALERQDKEPEDGGADQTVQSLMRDTQAEWMGAHAAVSLAKTLGAQIQAGKIYRSAESQK